MVCREARVEHGPLMLPDRSLDRDHVAGAQEVVEVSRLQRAFRQTLHSGDILTDHIRIGHDEPSGPYWPPVHVEDIAEIPFLLNVVQPILNMCVGREGSSTVAGDVEMAEEHGLHGWSGKTVHLGSFPAKEEAEVDDESHHERTDDGK